MAVYGTSGASLPPTHYNVDFHVEGTGRFSTIESYLFSLTNPADVAEATKLLENIQSAAGKALKAATAQRDANSGDASSAPIRKATFMNDKHSINDGKAITSEEGVQTAEAALRSACDKAVAFYKQIKARDGMAIEVREEHPQPLVPDQQQLPPAILPEHHDTHEPSTEPVDVLRSSPPPGPVITAEYLERLTSQYDTIIANNKDPNAIVLQTAVRKLIEELDDARALMPEDFPDKTATLKTIDYQIEHLKIVLLNLRFEGINDSSPQETVRDLLIDFENIKMNLTPDFPDRDDMIRSLNSQMLALRMLAPPTINAAHLDELKGRFETLSKAYESFDLESLKPQFQILLEDLEYARDHLHEGGPTLNTPDMRDGLRTRMNAILPLFGREPIEHS